MLSGFNPEQINDIEGARRALREILNLVEELKQGNQALREEVQRLRDENNRLKGEQGKPEIKGNKGDEKRAAYASEKARREPKVRQKGTKNEWIKIDRTEKVCVNRAELPGDAEFKGYEPVVVQDIEIKTANVRFEKEKYYSPSQQKSYLAALPVGYEGAYGPGVRAMVLNLYYACGMTEPKIEELLGNLGIRISAGQVSNLLVKEKEPWHEEKAAVVAAGLASTSWHHIDDTATRVNGENQHCHILCNPFYSAYFTEPNKDRLTVIRVLQGGGELSYLFQAETVAWLDVFKIPLAAQRQIALWPQGIPLTAHQLDAFLARDLAHLNQQQQARIREAAALTAYHQPREWPLVEQLISDDAPQFQQVTAEQALCWVHEGRHYQKLSPFVEYHQQRLSHFLTDFWDFYHKLQRYRESPDNAQALRLGQEFDTLFATVTGYDELDKRIAKSMARKDKLLLVLRHPALPLHNNPAELAARQRVRKRDISFGPRTQDGVKAWDTFMTLSETAKKLGVNFYRYLHDRVSGARHFPSLASLIPPRTLGQLPAHVSALPQLSTPLY